jgi:hypothetical protein
MCCNTHADRDALDRAHQVDVDALLAPSEAWRCRCSQTSARCQRKATGEDLLCDWCRTVDHMAFCASVVEPYEAAVRPYGSGTDFYAAGRVGAFEFSLPLRYERSLIGDYRLGLHVAQPPSLVIVTGIG